MNARDVYILCLLLLLLLLPPFYGHYTEQQAVLAAPPQLRNGGFCWSKVLLPACQREKMLEFSLLVLRAPYAYHLPHQPQSCVNMHFTVLCNEIS